MTAGVRQIVRFNWTFYLGGVLSVAVAVMTLRIVATTPAALTIAVIGVAVIVVLDRRFPGRLMVRLRPLGADALGVDRRSAWLHAATLDQLSTRGSTSRRPR